jgi:membrane-associated protein
MFIIDIFLHLDQHLLELAQTMGPWLYWALFLVLFAETGLVITPFLPGDSLLFAVGAVSALPDSPIHIVNTSFLLILAAFLGDNVNYQVGSWVGPRAFANEKSLWLNPRNLAKTQAFFEKYGSFAIFLGRFAPIIRTFAPFVAGMGRMNYRKFCLNSFFGSLVWIHLFLYAGYFFGNLAFVKKNFHYVILAVIIVSLVPMVVGALKRNSAAQK